MPKLNNENPFGEEVIRMKLLDEIICQRDHIYRVVEPLNVRWIRIYGSVLERKETAMSDVDLYVSFDKHKNRLECWKRCKQVADVLESIFSRRISVQCESHIYKRFRETTQRDSVDLRELEHSKSYQITPKSSTLYYEMLRRDIDEWNIFYTKFSQDSIKERHWTLDMDSKYQLHQRQYHVDTFLRRSTWWFSRLMRLKDNDIFKQTEFDVFGLIQLSAEEENTLEWRQRCESKSFVEVISYINKCVQGLSTWVKRNGH